MIDLAKVRAAAAGFRGRFVADPEHTEDRGIGNIADVVDFDDRLVYVPDGADIRDDDCYVIADPLELHVAEPIAEMLNAVPALLELVAAPAGDIDRAVELAFRRERDEARAALADLVQRQLEIDAERDSLSKALAHHVAEIERLQGERRELMDDVAVLRRRMAEQQDVINRARAQGVAR